MSYMIMTKADELCLSLVTSYRGFVTTQAFGLFAHYKTHFDPGILFQFLTRTHGSAVRGSIYGVSTSSELVQFLLLIRPLRALFVLSYLTSRSL